MIRKVAMILASCVLSVQGLTDVTVPKTWAARDTLTRTNLNKINDTIYTRMNQLNDSLEVNFVRFSDVKDSTFQKVKCDSIRSNPDIDSIQGNPRIDTLTVTTTATAANLTATNKVTADSVRTEYIRGNPNIDSISGSPRINAATLTGGLSVGGTIAADTVIGALTIDSLRIRTGSYLGTYQSATAMPCSLYSYGNSDSLLDVGSANYTRMGNIVAIHFPQLSGEVRGSGGAYVRFAVPAILTSGSLTLGAPVISNSGDQAGSIVMNPAEPIMFLYQSNGSDIADGTGGIYECVVVYVID